MSAGSSSSPVMWTRNPQKKLMNAAVCSMSDRVMVLSHRPAVVRAVHTLEEYRGLSPIQRRNTPGFSAIFNQIWKELDVNA